MNKTAVYKTGYHYTSHKNWEHIQKYGFLPYIIEEPELLEYFDAYPKGIWLWENDDASPESQLGSIIYQLATKGATKIVKLSVKYDENLMLYYERFGSRRKVRLPHSGTIGQWAFHTDEPEAIIYLAPIPATNVSLMREYDLLDVVAK